MGDSKSVIRTQRRKKQRVIEYLGGKCNICGYDRCHGALEFHHIDPQVKEAKPSYIVHRWSWEKVKPELDKCILLCSNCHREVHFGFRTPEEVRVAYRPEIIKDCPVCRAEFATRNDEQIYCTNRCRGFVQRRTERPDRDTLGVLLREQSWTAIGRKYGVTDNSVRKWAKSYGLSK